MRKYVIFAILGIMAGCQSAIHLHPIETIDIVAVKKGETITAPKDGFFLSKFYVAEVMEAKVR